MCAELTAAISRISSQSGTTSQVGARNSLVAEAPTCPASTSDESTRSNAPRLSATSRWRSSGVLVAQYRRVSPVSESVHQFGERGAGNWMSSGGLFKMIF